MRIGIIGSLQFADILVVGIESDQRVGSYKPGRPIIDERSRANIVSDLQSVDYVFIKDIDFNSQEHVKLYKEFGIDFYTIGDDYFPEAEKRTRSDCKEAEATLVKLDVIKRYTTTRIIDKVKNESRS